MAYLFHFNFFLNDSGSWLGLTLLGFLPTPTPHQGAQKFFNFIYLFIYLFRPVLEFSSALPAAGTLPFLFTARVRRLVAAHRRSNSLPSLHMCEGRAKRSQPPSSGAPPPPMPLSTSPKQSDVAPSFPLRLCLGSNLPGS